MALKTFKNTYTSAQTDLAMITPASGKKIFIWSACIEADNSGKIELQTSSKTILDLTTVGEGGTSNPNAEGAVDEVLTLNCGAGDTTVSVLYDEL